MTDEKIIFADTEGDELLDDITRLWMIQIAETEDEEPTVYADQPGYEPISKAISILKNCDKVVFHNGMGFDLFAVNKFYPGTLKRSQIIDSLVMSRFRNSTARRHSLGDLGELVGVKKGHFKDFSKFSEEMVEYGKQDVRILQRLWKGKKGKFVGFGYTYEKYREALDLEFEVAYLLAIEQFHGFRLNVEGAQLLETDLKQRTEDISRELKEIFPDRVFERYSDKTGKRLKDGLDVFNPGSRQQIGERLIEKYGWKPVKKTPTGIPKIDEDILSDLPYYEAKLFSEYLKLDKMIGQISQGAGAWLKLVDEYSDGTHYCHPYINGIGARTHRMSHSGPNIAQVSTDPRMRELWLPDRGDVLIGVDAEGLELRMLAHYLFPYDNGVYAEKVHSGNKKIGTDVHTMNMNAAGLHLRDSAKTMIYAHNYGCFDLKLGNIVINDAKEAGKPVPSGSAKKIGADLRVKLTTGVTGLGKLIDKCSKSHKEKKALPGLDGRWIPSASDHSSLNTLLQGNGSVVMKEALRVFERLLVENDYVDEHDHTKRKVKYCANVHDEFQASSHPSIAKHVAELGKQSITIAGEVLSVRCPLMGEAKIGRNWRETH